MAKGLVWTLVFGGFGLVLSYVLVLVTWDGMVLALLLPFLLLIWMGGLLLIYR